MLLPLGVFVALATHKIRAPGLYYDELFVISPAFGAPAYKTLFGVPLMTSSYVGAEKSWIYPPIFALFGVSAWSIRLPAILMSCGTLVLPLCVLGFWDKFNFIWFAIALPVATCAVYGEVILRKLRQVQSWILVIAGIGLSAGGMVILWIIFPLFQRPASAAFSARLLHIWTLYQWTCTGLATARMWFKSVPTLPSWTGWSILALTIVFLSLALVGYLVSTSPTKKLDGRALRFCLWSLLMFGIIFLEIALTPQAGGAHHTIMLFPLDLLTCFSAAFLFVRTLPLRMHLPVTLLQALLLLTWMGAEGRSLQAHFDRFREKANFWGRFSPRI